MESSVDIHLQKFTPLIRQYQAVKRSVGDAILFFRLGDFYEMFNEDAVDASKILGILLTKKSAGTGNSVPLAGVPYHSADTYITRLVKAGRKVAICEQVTAPGDKSRGIMERAVVRIITPGTVVEETLLAPNVDNFLGALSWGDGQVGFACVDISSGEFQMGQWPADAETFRNVFARAYLRELIVPEKHSAASDTFIQGVNLPVSRRPDFSPEESIEMLGERFGVGAIEAAGLTRTTVALSATGLLLRYLAETRSDDLPIRFPRFFTGEGRMELDPATIRNLELLESTSGDARAGLLSVFDRAKTPMGSRLLRRWVLAPLVRAADIAARQDGVAALVAAPPSLDAIRSALGGIGDLDRVLARLARPATARVADLATLRGSLAASPAVESGVRGIAAFAKETTDWPDVSALRALLHKRLAENPSGVIGEGNVIKSGVHPELDELKELLENQRLHLLKFQETERARTGIATLKVSYNKIYGYYIEISKTNAESAPDDYIRKQTLVNAERYITPQLKTFEEKLLAASDRIASIERELFSRLLTDVLGHAGAIRELSDRIARIDALASLAETARHGRFVRPQLTDEDVLHIQDGRHPVVEKFCAAGFVPNDTHLDMSRRLAVVTGPNMAGKSTFIRQTAVLTLMAQLGSFVPAKSMKWRPVDRIFTRIGASDDLSRGQSTFFVEMSETAAILRQSSRDSLILLDEIGRGTSTYDGLSIAWAVLEHIAGTIGAKTLFATHYHELADLAGHNGIHTLTVMVREWEGKVVFLRKVKDGSSDRSFGIAVADLAGIPRPVLDRARILLTQLESANASSVRRPAVADQTDLFASSSSQEYEQLKKRLKQIDLSRTAPLDVSAALAKIQEELQ